MALTAAERKRRQREKERKRAEEERHKGGDAAAHLYRTPFSEWVARSGKLDDLIEYTALAGFELPSFEDERDPDEFVIDRDCFGEVDLFGDAKGAWGSAEATIGLLQDTAMILAQAVNAYKRQEIEVRLAELEDPAEVDRSEALKEAVRLNKMLDQLKKQVRRNFPQWKVMGD